MRVGFSIKREKTCSWRNFHLAGKFVTLASLKLLNSHTTISFQRFTALFLLLCLTLPFLGTYTWLKMEKRKVKKTIKWRMIDGMDKSELVLLKFTKEEAEAELEWEHSREFEYNGQMYDVVEKNEVGDTTYYYCWWDHEETKLNRQLSELVANAMGKNPLNKEKQERLTNFIKNLFLKNHFDKQALQLSGEETIHPSAHITYSSFRFSPPTPPPEVV